MLPPQKWYMVDRRAGLDMRSGFCESAELTSTNFGMHLYYLNVFFAD
jgi:hypothetical protein